MTDFLLCDVFAERPFAGNQLAVFLDAAGVTDEQMRLLAREFGWSEITFALREGDGCRVRIWTPVGELPFAGHPTVGTAVVLAAAGRVPEGVMTLQLGIGPVEVDVRLEGSRVGTATMTQREPRWGPVREDRAELAAALSLSPEDVPEELPIQPVSTGLEQLLVPVRSLEALGRARLDLDRFQSLVRDQPASAAYLFTTDTPGTTAAARARLLISWGEDPATGSAAGPLGAYLVRYGLHRAGELEIEQGIEMGRPSRIRVEVPMESGEIGPVRVTGEVHIWGEGSLQV